MRLKVYDLAAGRYDGFPFVRVLEIEGKTMKKYLVVVAAFVCCFSLTVSAQETTKPSEQVDDKKTIQSEEKMETAEENKNALSFTMKSIDGNDVELSKYLGNVVVVVNTASRCGLTPQYKQLQELHTNYADKGVKVLGFPCNQFGGQEPGSEADIKTFCSKNYGVTFDMFAKVDVNGESACELYKFLKSQETKPKGTGEIGWNFEKFILDKSGKPIARFGSRVKPDAAEFTSVIEQALAEEEK